LPERKVSQKDEEYRFNAAKWAVISGVLAV
jgi:hypothetical protein